MEDWGAVTKILQYLKGTREMLLTYRKAGRFRLESFTNASYAEDKGDGCSLSKIVTMFGGTPLSGSSETPACIPLSSSVAEYLALADDTKEVLYLTMVLDILCPESPENESQNLSRYARCD